VYNVRTAEVPGGKGDGVPVTSLIDTQGAAVVGLFSGAPETAVLLATSGGNALRARLENLQTRQRAGKSFASLAEGERLLTPVTLAPEAKEVAALSGEGRLLVFPLDEVPELANGGRGVMAMKLHEGEAMLGLQPATPEGLRIAAIGRGDKRTTLEVKRGDYAHYRGARARTGRKLESYFKKVEGFE
jgi:topoisomerase IV subunit A